MRSYPLLLLLTFWPLFGFSREARQLVFVLSGGFNSCEGSARIGGTFREHLRGLVESVPACRNLPVKYVSTCYGGKLPDVSGLSKLDNWRNAENFLRNQLEHSEKEDLLFNVDGVYFDTQGKLKFFRVPGPTDGEIAVLVQRIRDRVVRYLTKKGYSIDDFSEDPFAFEQPVMAELAGASIQSRIALGERAGQKVRRVGNDVPIGDVYRIGNRSAVCDGFSLHANVKIEGPDRDKLEKLCRYTARPPVALERLSETGDGKILYRLKTQYSDGTTHVLFDPMELVEKVVALIPPPRANLLRYHGVFAPNSKDRKRIVPTLTSDSAKKKQERPNSSWSDLLKRSFSVDVMLCGSCGGKMRFVSHIEEPVVVKRILGHLGLPTEAPQLFPARAPPQMAMFEVPPTENDEFYQPSFD